MGARVARLVVIGGGAAGMSAASAARRADPGLDVLVCEAGGFAAYGMCGIPYYLGGTVPEAENLLAHPPSVFREKRGIDLRLHTRVTGIDTAARTVRLAGPGESLAWDRLAVTSGADPVRPPVPEAQAAGLDAVATDEVSRSRAKYYPGASPLHVRLVHTRDGRLLGGQLAGREGAAKRVDVLATAIHAGFSVDDLAALDLSYSPPFAPVYDPVLAAEIKAARGMATLTAGGSP